MKYTNEVRQRIDGYLAEVERHMALRHSDERAAVLADLKLHIHEALRRSVQASPTVEDVQRVLAAMDAPEAYSSGVEDVPAALPQAQALPQTQAKRPGWLERLNTLPLVMVYMALIAAAFVGVKSEMLLREMDIEPPALTSLVLGWQAFFAQLPFVILALMLASVYYYWRWAQTRSPRLAYVNSALVCASFAICSLAAAGVMLPGITVMEHIGR